MRILHLFSNTKLTGPAEPAINLCVSLKQSGCDILFACPASSRANSAVRAIARERGLDPITEFRLNKHLNIVDNIYDVRKLPRFLREANVDMVHTHLNNDHLVGGSSARRANPNILVVRSYYGEGLKAPLRNRRLLGKLTDGIVTYSESARKSIAGKCGFPEERIEVVAGAIDTARFSPSASSDNFRETFGFKHDDFVFGVVARIQPYRRFDVLLEAVRQVSGNEPKTKLLIVGRGSKAQQVAVEPVRRMNLGDSVKFAGYQDGRNYVNTLACLDAVIYLMPGTDGTCRAIREAMAMGKPVIAANRGMLPEIVDHGVNGLVIEDTPNNLAEAMTHLATNPEVVASMSEHAARKAHERFRLDTQAESVARFYKRLGEQGRLR